MPLRLLAVCFAALVLAPAASARVYLGVLGSPSRFQAQTGQRSHTRLLIAGWSQTNFAQLFGMMGERPMLGINTGGSGRESISPAAIARGAGDGYLIALNRAVAAWGKPLYVRPLAEMNGHWNGYCAFNRNGTRRDASHSTAWFRKAFTRMYLVVHGGGDVNRRLARLGLPPVAAGLETNPLVRVIWNPQGYGSPDVPGNSAQAYYPGDAYVDVVGNDLYDIRGKVEWAANERLYRAHPSKPFAVPEWGLWGLDDPGFVRKMAAFVRGHRRVELISYYSGRPGSVFDLRTKPASLAVYRRLIVPLGR
jgi:hypothetical protein